MSKAVKVEINLSIKCRSCLSEDKQMHYLFAEFDQGLTLADIFKSTTSFKVKENDAWSSYLCDNCTNTVVDFFNLKLMYTENSKYIQTLLANKSFDDYVLVQSEEGKTLEYDTNPEKAFENPSDGITFVEVDQEDGDDFLICKNSECPIDIQEIKEEPDEKKLLDCVKYCCEECKESFTNALVYQEHIFQKHRTKIKNSPKKVVARKPNKNKSKIQLNSQSTENKTNNPKYVCEVCGASYKRKCRFNDHMEVHSKDRPYVCTVCGKSFRLRTTFTQHKKIHTHYRCFVCEVCGKRFNDKPTLKTHIKIIHIKERNYCCHVCNAAFSLRGTLMKHLRRHNKDREKEFFCSMCPAGYTDKSCLNRHILIKHTEGYQKPTCVFCGKQYTQKMKMKIHMEKKHNYLGEIVTTENFVS